MLVVKVELWPHGDRTRKRELGQMTVSNIGGDVERGNYLVQASEHPSDVTGLDKGLNESFVVQNHLRRSSVWALVGRAAGMADMHNNMRRLADEVREERKEKKA